MTGDVGPLERMRAAIAADAAHGDPAVWIHRVPDAALLARAKVLEAEGPRGRVLWGMPVGVKDCLDVAGLPTTAGCPAYAYLPERDAVAVARLLEAGAVVMGKTNLDQFATGLVGVRSPYGVPRAPFDRLVAGGPHVPGGSSSGSGAVVAAGIVPVALGSDTAGSGRVPAMFGNVVGLKPTVGAVPTMGMVPACRSIDTISVFARTVDEALTVGRVIAGYEAADPYSRRAPAGYLRRGGAGRGAAAGLRVAVADDLSACDAWVRDGVLATAAQLGAVPVEIGPFLALARLLYDGPWVAERTAALRGMLEQPDALFPATRTILEGGLSRRTVDAFDAFHVLADVRRRAEVLFEAHDVLLLPTAPCWPTLAQLEADAFAANTRLGTYTNFANLCDLAAIAVPCGFSAEGWPVGVTLVGPAWSEGRLAGIADAIHRAATDRVGATVTPLPAALPPDDLRSDETALFCVGGHMRGLPLNGQLTALGARFLREAHTAPAYRLYAMGARPGLVGGGTGVIEGELWAVPTHAVGALLAQVPPPLGFGTVLLADGACLGFLAEADKVDGAPDITSSGGWRAFIK